MTQPDPSADAVLGACQPCGSVWVLTLVAANCLSCGRPPSHSIALPSAGGASDLPMPPATGAEAPPAELVTLPLVCPSCDTSLDVTIGDEGLTARTLFVLDVDEEAAPEEPAQETEPEAEPAPAAAEPPESAP